MRLQSYMSGEWQGGGGRAAVLRDASTGAVVAEAASEGLDFAAALAHARGVGGPGAARDDLPRARGHAARARQAPARLQARVLRALARDRRDPRRLLDRHRRRHRHDAGVREQGRARAAGRPRLPRRRRRAAVEGRQLRRPAHLRAARGRGGAHQRLQLPGLGHAREARAGAARRRAGDRQARDRDQLPHRARRAAHRRDRAPARGRAAAHLRRRRRPVRPSRLPGRRLVHRLGGDRGEAAHASGRRRATRSASSPKPTRSIPRYSGRTRGPARPSSSSSSRKSRAR